MPYRPNHFHGVKDLAGRANSKLIHRDDIGVLKLTGKTAAEQDLRRRAAALLAGTRGVNDVLTIFENYRKVNRIS